MEDESANTLLQFFDVLRDHPAFLFRGVSDVEKHQLIPSIGRNWLSGLNDLVAIEKEMLEQFKTKATILLDTNKPSNDWEWLILGQHYGMLTRLLDWTSNYLVALYFACSNDFSVDGAVYLASGLEKLEPEVVRDPFNIPKCFYLAPRHISPRIAAQSAYFTVSRDPLEPLKVSHNYFNPSEPEIETSNARIIIRSGAKLHILNQLRRINIGSASLFPGLDGLAKQISMEHLYLRDIENQRFKTYYNVRKILHGTKNKEKKK